MLAMVCFDGKYTVRGRGIGNAISGRSPGRFPAHARQRSEPAQDLIEMFRFPGEELEPVTARDIAIRAGAFHLLPEPALHTLQIESVAAAGIQRLRRAQGEPIEFHKDPVVPFRSLRREDVPLIENLKRYG